MASTWITANPPNVQYEESFFDVSSVRYENHTAVRHCQVQGVDRFNFEQAMLGYSILGDSSRAALPIPKPIGALDKNPATASIIRFPPALHPDRPYLIATSCDFVQFLGPMTRNDNSVITEFYGGPPIPVPVAFFTPLVQRAEYSIEYTFPEDGTIYLPDAYGVGQPNELWRYVKRRVEYDVVNAPIPKISLKVYKADGSTDPVSQPGASIIGSATLYYTWLQIPAEYGSGGQPILPGNLETNIANCVGTVNSGTFDGYTASTLICLAPKRRLLPQSDGQYTWEITYIFGQRGWDPGNTLPALDANKTPSTIPSWQRSLLANGTFGYVTRQDGVTPLYTSSDFTKLFQLI